MKLIAFTGKLGVGKSTAISALAKYLQNKQSVRLFKFAQPLYDIQEFVYGRINDAYQRPESFIKDRKLLQWVGTEWGRGLSENLWVDLWQAEVENYLTDNDNVVVVCDDVRFNNEAEVVKQMGGYIIRIEANDQRAESGLTNHASEAGINADYIDFSVTNNGTFEEFHQSLFTVFKVIESKQTGSNRS